MTQKNLLKTMLLLCAILMAGASTAWATTVTLDMTAQGWSNASDPTTVTQDGVELTWGSGVKYYTGAIRFYANNTLTLKSSSKITDVAFTVSGNYTMNFGASVGTVDNSNESWSGNANEVTFTNKASSQYRFSRITVTLEGAAALADETLTVNATNGTVEISGKTANSDGTYTIKATNQVTATATPAEHYQFSKWTATDVTLDDDTANPLTFTMPENNVTLTATFVELSKGTVTFMVNGESAGTQTNVYEGEDIEFPAVSALAGYSFVGWTTAEISGSQATAPATLVTTATMGSTDITYYAVFAVGTESTAWKKLSVYDLNTEGAGIYAIITPDGHAFSGTISSGHGGITTDAFSFTSNIATSAPDGTCELTLTAVEGGFKVYNPSTNKYLYATKSTSGGLAWQTTENSYWKLTNSTSANFVYNAKSAYLRSYNNDSFRTYGGATNDVINFVKKVQIASYSDYRTTVATTGTITLNAACNDGSVVYGTFYTDRAYVMPESLDGSVVSVDSEGKLVVDAVYEGSKGDVVPANTPLLINSYDTFTGTKDYTITYTSAAGDDFSDYNMLKGTLTADETTEGINCLFYRLTMHNGTQIGFWWGAENGGAFKPGANKAYLAVPQTLARSGFTLFDDESTAVSSIRSTQTQQLVLFNLQGQRVEKATKGLYIVNGKKYINK